MARSLSYGGRREAPFLGDEPCEPDALWGIRRPGGGGLLPPPKKEHHVIF